MDNRDQSMVTMGITDRDWHDANGEICSNCAQEAWRLLEGLCADCVRRRVAREDRDLERKEMQRHLMRLFRGRRNAAKR
jgi:hypothetical protein